METVGTVGEQVEWGSARDAVGVGEEAEQRNPDDTLREKGQGEEVDMNDVKEEEMKFAVNQEARLEFGVERVTETTETGSRLATAQTGEQGCREGDGLSSSESPTSPSMEEQSKGESVELNTVHTEPNTHRQCVGNTVLDCDVQGENISHGFGDVKVTMENSPNDDTENVNHSRMESTQESDTEPTHCSFDFKWTPWLLNETCSEFSFQKENFLKGCKWAPDGTCLATTSEDNIVRVFNLPSQLCQDNSTEPTSDMVYGLIYRVSQKSGPRRKKTLHIIL
uniref:Telomerase Cajal body protein 1 n=1 Tax=Eptatretus burgeri TaxID=7764 RepID=A0A8C4R5A0_EPTBU